MQAAVKMANAPDLSLRWRFAPMAISPTRSGQCRGADCRARRRTCNLYKPPSKWQTLPICHCEEANGRRGNLGKAVTLIAPAIVGERTAGPGGALTVRTSHRQNGKRFRFVIARRPTADVAP